jgi:ribonuclease E
MASREEPQVEDTRGLPDVPAPQETLFEEEPSPEETAEATAGPERNGDTPSATSEPGVVSPARPRGVASFPGGPPPVSTPPPTAPLFPQAEPVTPAKLSFRVTTVESTAAFRPAGPPPAAPPPTETSPALAAEPEPEVEVEEVEIQAEVTAAVEPQTAVEPAAEATVEAAPPAAEASATAEVAPPAAEAAVKVEPPAAEASATAKVETPPAKPARRTRSGRTSKARDRAAATTTEAPATETPVTGAAAPEAAAAEAPVVETAAQAPPTASGSVEIEAAGPSGGEPAEMGEEPAARPATRGRRRRSRSGRAATQPDGEPAAESQTAIQPVAAAEPSATGPETAEAPTPEAAASSDAGQGTAAAEVATGTGEIQAEEDVAGAEASRAGSARTRARRRRRAAAKARLRGAQPGEATGTAEAGEATATADGEPAGTQPASVGTERPAAERTRSAAARGPGRQRGAATAPAGGAPAAATTTAGTEEAAPAPARGRGRGRRRVGSRSQGEAATATATSTATEPAPAPAPAPARTPAPAERSTRLEASRARGTRQGQGGDRGRRRRRGGLTEDQKRVLREGPERRMLVTEGAERTQIGVIEGRTLVEHYVTRKTGRSMVGNIYLGRVQNVLPGMEAAFIDIGKGRNAVLYAGEVNYNEEDLDGEAPRIEKALKPGQAILVQVTKDPIGAKGARLTTQVSLAGRYLVLQPEDSTFGISRRLPEAERLRLREILKEVRPKGLGLIVRTAAEGATADDLRADLARLQARWDTIERKAKKASPPAVIYQEPELVVRVIRDIFSPDFVELVVDAPGLYERVKTYLEEVAPDLLPKVRAHDGRLALFEQYRVSEQIHKALERKVWLPSGGSLVIDQTEAMTVVDVNTGKYVGKSNLEETVVATNLEAAEEIVRQLRLRDIGGIIIIDFIDMLFEKNQHAVVERLRSALARDKTKSQVMEVSSLGLVQMTRKRVSGGLLDSFSETCPACEGRGVVITHEV